MNYSKKYIKYKTKYLEVKSVSNNDMMTMSGGGKFKI